MFTTPIGEPDSSMKLRLSNQFAGFTFAKEPMDAALMLNEESTHARVLKKVMMVTDQAVHAPTQPANYQSSTGNLPESASEGKQSEKEKLGEVASNNTVASGMMSGSSAVGTLDSSAATEGRAPENVSGSTQQHEKFCGTINSTEKQGEANSSKIIPDYSAQDAAIDFAEDAAASRGADAGEVAAGKSKLSNGTVGQDSYLCCCFM